MARDKTRDAVRGLTSLEMTFVNASNLSWAQHSPYIGQFTYADTVFPCFAFLSGMSPTPARRSIGLLGVGFGLNCVSAVAKQKPHIRLPGVLQRLGLASLLANATKLEAFREWCGLPLVLLWYLLTVVGSQNWENPLAHPNFANDDVLKTAQTRLDRFIFGDSLHTDSFDPEGLLGALTTAVSMILGRWFVETRTAGPQKGVIAAGMILTGETLHYSLPKYAAISKNLWTPSFVLVTSGVSMLKYLAVDKTLEYLPSTLQNILAAVGQRSLESYIFSALLTLAVHYGGSKSVWARLNVLLLKLVGKAGADFIASAGLSTTVAAFAQVLVSCNLKLRW